MRWNESPSWNETPTRRRGGAAALAGVGLSCALLAAACGGDDGAPAAQAPVSSPPSVVTQTVSASSAAPGTTAQEPTSAGTAATGTAQQPTSGTPGAGRDGLQCTPPTDPEAYADRFVQAWGVGDRAVMDCLGTPDAVEYALRYQETLGPGWTRLRATGEQQTRTVGYGSPNHKTVADVTVDRGGFGGGTAREHQVVAVRIG